MWINRDFLSTWNKKGAQSIRVLVGPRQSGKSSFLLRHAEKERAFVSLDDLAARELAQSDPKTFLAQSPSPLLCDEIQYAPNLLPELKLKIDAYKQKRLASKEKAGKAPSYWITGSNRILLDKQVAESLTGRASYYFFHPLSVKEILSFDPKASWGDIFLRGGWPELWSDRKIDPVRYLNDHIQTTLEKDLVKAAGITKIEEFLRSLRLHAGRLGHLVNASEISRDAKVKSETISDWMSFVIRMMYAVEVPAFSSSITTRLVKAPKFYFLDSAIACRLQAWTSSEPMFISPAIGGLFENLVVSEIIKIRDIFAKDWQLFHWRTRDGEEMDLILAGQKENLAIECKFSGQQALNYKIPKTLRNSKSLRYVVVSLTGGPNGKEFEHLSLAELGNHLLQNF